jgi:hypothetical protein
VQRGELRRGEKAHHRLSYRIGRRDFQYRRSVALAEPTSAAASTLNRRSWRSLWSGRLLGYEGRGRRRDYRLHESPTSHSQVHYHPRNDPVKLEHPGWNTPQTGLIPRLQNAYWNSCGVNSIR